MTPQEEQHLEHFFNEFLSLVERARSMGWMGEPESWLSWGYQQSLQQEGSASFFPEPEAVRDGLVRLAYQLALDESVCSRPMEAQALLYIGHGFFFGLRLSRSISLGLFEHLSLQLSKWLDRSEHYRTIMEALFYPSSSVDRQLLLRQRAHLVQLLRQQNHPEWRRVRESFFQPDTAGDKERQRWIEELSNSLQPEEFESISLLRKGGMFSSKGSSLPK